MMELYDWIHENRPSRVVILTGAGISAESGIPTFRGNDGLWDRYSLEDLATPEGFERNPALVWKWYEWRRAAIRAAEPNAAHLAIAELETSGALDEFLLVTQNVDELHRRAGSRNLIEIHGSVVRCRCSRDGTRVEHPEPFAELPPRCECGALMRPDVVWFGEPLSSADLDAAAAAAERSHLLLVVGTSSQVYPAAGIAHQAGGKTVEVNPQRTDFSRLADFCVAQSAVAAIPRICRAIVEARS